MLDRRSLERGGQGRSHPPLERVAGKLLHLLFDDVERPPGRLCDALRLEQDTRFFGIGPTMQPALMESA